MRFRRFDQCIRKVIRTIAFAGLLLITIAGSGCGSRSAQPAALAPVLPPAVKSAQPVLLYVGAGTSPTDVTAIEGILSGLNIGYLTADQSELEGMTEPVLGGYTLLIVPGGNSITIGQSLSANATTTIRNAVAQ